MSLVQTVKVLASLLVAWRDVDTMSPNIHIEVFITTWYTGNDIDGITHTKFFVHALFISHQAMHSASCSLYSLTSQTGFLKKREGSGELCI